MRKTKGPDPAIVEEVRRLLRDARVTQYALRRAGLSSKTSQILLGEVSGTPSLAALEIALGCLSPRRSLWHVVAKDKR